MMDVLTSTMPIIMTELRATEETRMSYNNPLKTGDAILSIVFVPQTTQNDTLLHLHVARAIHIKPLSRNMLCPKNAIKLSQPRYLIFYEILHCEMLVQLFTHKFQNKYKYANTNFGTSWKPHSAASPYNG